MAGSCLTEDCGISCNGDITSAADFLTAGYAHAIHAADDRFLAHQNCINHGIEEGHVLVILGWLLRVIFRVLFSVAAGAEGIVTGTGKDYGDYIALFLSPLETGDNALTEPGYSG
jgi:hypothetical protein